jgi:ABC-2 type transport system permease protein
VLVFGIVALGFAPVNGERWLSHLNDVRAATTQQDASARGIARAIAARIDSGEQPPSLFDPRNAFVYADYLMSHFAVLPATPLAALTVGQSDLLPSALPLAPGRLPSIADGAEPENPHRLLIGRFDTAFAIIFLFPLLIIGLSYALLAGERERGTLALLLAQPLSLLSLFVGKIVPRLLLVGGLLLAFAAISAAIVPVSAWPRLAMWLTVAIAYAAFWVALTALVVTRDGNTATHAVMLAAAWLGLTLLVPTLVNLAVKTMVPVPSRVELILASRAATDEATAERSHLLGAFYEDHPDLAPAGSDTGHGEDFITLQLLTAQRVERDLTPVLARFSDQLTRQRQLVEKLKYLSPALLAQSAFADAAGTGSARYDLFFGQVRAHHSKLRAFFEPRVLSKERFTAWDDVPAFDYVDETNIAVVARLVPAVGALLCAALGCALLSWLTLRRQHLA